MPLAALHRLVQDGELGELASDFVSCMGGIYSQRRVREETVPAIESVFREQAVDLALLIPM